jgi:pilus assembly protein CpaC
MNVTVHYRLGQRQKPLRPRGLVPLLALSLLVWCSAATADETEEPKKPKGTRIVQPLIVQASYQESKSDKAGTPAKSPSKTETIQPPSSGSNQGLPEPPKFPNLDNKTPTMPNKVDAQEKSKASDPFQPRARLNSLDAPLGSTPKPDDKTLEKYRSLVESIDDPDNVLDLVVGRPRILQLKQAPVKFQTVDPTIADIEVIRDSKDKAFFVLGKQPGTTVIALFFAEPGTPDKFKVLNYLVRVVPDPEAKSRIERVYKALEDEVNRAFPNSVVRLCLVGDKLVVAGQAKDSAEAAKILAVVREQAPLATPPSRIPVDRIDVTLQADPNNPDQSIAQGLQNFVVSGNANIINLLRVPGEQQVMLRVQVAEVQRNALRSIGMNFALLNNAGTTVFGQRTGGLLGADNAFGPNANLAASLDGGSFLLAMNALRQMGYSRTLAEPTLVSLNGQAATFQAGGEFPVPVVTGNAVNALQGVNYRPFGVSLNFTPLVFDKDRIRLTINAEVTALSGTTVNALQGGNNFQIPGQLNSRRFTNVVELREGQTLAVAGLISNTLGTQSNRVPLFGDVPLLGRAFGFDSVTSSEQELVFLITPELVHPMEHGEVPPMPGHNVFEPGDTEFYLLNRLESRRSEDYRAGARTDINRMLNYRQGKDQYITGPFGLSSAPVNPGPNNVVLPNQPATLPTPNKTVTPPR